MYASRLFCPSLGLDGALAQIITLKYSECILSL